MTASPTQTSRTFAKPNRQQQSEYASQSWLNRIKNAPKKLHAAIVGEIAILLTLCKLLPTAIEEVKIAEEGQIHGPITHGVFAHTIISLIYIKCAIAAYRLARSVYLAAHHYNLFQQAKKNPALKKFLPGEKAVIIKNAVFYITLRTLIFIPATLAVAFAASGLYAITPLLFTIVVGLEVVDAFFDRYRLGKQIQYLEDLCKKEQDPREQKIIAQMINNLKVDKWFVYLEIISAISVFGAFCTLLSPLSSVIGLHAIMATVGLQMLGFCVRCVALRIRHQQQKRAENTPQEANVPARRGAEQNKLSSRQTRSHSLSTTPVYKNRIAQGRPRSTSLPPAPPALPPAPPALVVNASPTQYKVG